MSRMFFPPVNPIKWLSDMEHVRDYPFGEVPHPDDDEEDGEDKRVVRITRGGVRTSGGRITVSGSEDSDLPVNRGRPRDTKDSSHSYLPSKRGKCKKGYYYDPRRNLCVKY